MNPYTLYYLDSHMTHFSARVTGCTPKDRDWEITLDNTAFYPEGGGQPADRGTLGGVSVLDVQERGEEILHLCNGPLTVGEQVDGEICWQRRFDLMQQHSGEHILSGIIHSRYGFHNVGFHMGADTTTIDFDGIIPQEDIPRLELAANQAIWQDVPVECRFVADEALGHETYRSKKALTGTVRLVTFPGYDCCACCGTHVQRSGQVGMIKILSWEKFHQGVRMEIVCGGRALQYFSALAEQNRQVSNLFSAKPLETGTVAGKFKEDHEALRFRLGALESQLFDAIASEYAGTGEVVLFRDDLSPDALRRLADKVGAVCGGRCAVFSGSDREGYRYAICHQGGDLRAFTQEFNRTLRGRGGGKPNFVQGSCAATRQEIESCLRP